MSLRKYKLILRYIIDILNFNSHHVFPIYIPFKKSITGVHNILTVV